MKRSLLLPAAAALAALALAAARPAHAQEVRGRLTEQGSGAPVRGAAVYLGDETGAWRVPAAVSDAEGRFALAAPGAGAWRLRVRRIGYRDVVTAPFALAAGATREEEVALPVEPLTLEGIRAEAAPRCEQRPRGGAELERVWDEARKALYLASRTAAAAELEYEYATFDRVLVPDGGRAVRDSTTVSVGTAVPFLSAPADTLAAHGYVRVEGTELAIYGPDAEVFLSESFLDTHCFRLRSGPAGRPDLVGLEFEPVRGRRLPDVHGVMWLDRGSAELRWLEFGYTGFGGRDREKMRGRVEFARLPTGAWIVHNWSLRWPDGTRRTRRGEPVPILVRTLRLRETGGTVLQVRPRAPAAAADSAAAPSGSGGAAR